LGLSRWARLWARSRASGLMSQTAAMWTLGCCSDCFSKPVPRLPTPIEAVRISRSAARARSEAAITAIPPITKSLLRDNSCISASLIIGEVAYQSTTDRADIQPGAVDIKCRATNVHLLPVLLGKLDLSSAAGRPGISIRHRWLRGTEQAVIRTHWSSGRCLSASPSSARPAARDRSRSIGKKGVSAVIQLDSVLRRRDIRNHDGVLRPVGSRRSAGLLVLERGVILWLPAATENTAVAKELLDDLVARGVNQT
jgi:hypothetical protein